MTNRKIMQQALDMLVEPHPHIRTSFTDSIKYREKINQVIEALRQALAQPEQDNNCNPSDLCAGCRCAYSRLAQPEHPLDKKADNARELKLDYEPEQAPPHSAKGSADSAEGFGKPEQKSYLYEYAKNLAVFIWTKHYKKESPDWKPLPNVLGVLTQIDNMTCGLEKAQSDLMR